MKHTPFVAGNWKMNTNRTEAVALAREVAAGVTAKVQVGVAPPFVYLDAVGSALSGRNVMLAAQDASPEKNGAFTGEISVEMLKDLGVQFVLTGHSERRHVLHEPSELVAAKARAVYAGGLTLVHCVGEKLDQRDAGQTLAVIDRQLAELNIGEITDAQRLVVAYEPVWAIGTGRTATEAQAQEVHEFIRRRLGQMWNADFAERVRIQYGGSMNAQNASGLLQQPDVDGGLIGGASLKARTFLPIVLAAAAKVA